MPNPLPLWGILSVVGFLAVSTLAYNYRFIPDPGVLLHPCEGPEADALAKSLDLSQLVIERENDKLRFAGQIRWLWDLDPRDNIDIRLDTKRLQNGRYHTTPFLFARRDGCRALFNSSEPWYKWFTGYIYEEDRFCPSKRPQMIWHFHTFEASLLVRDVPLHDLDGHYKVHMYVRPVDYRGKPRKFHLCTQLRGELENA